MINKSNIWFLTLSSIILVLAIYYIGGPIEENKMVFSTSTNNNGESLIIKEDEVLTAMRIAKEEQYLEDLKVLQEVLLNNSATVAQKNEAYENIKYLNTTASLENKLEEKINATYNVSSFIQIDDTKIKVVIANKKSSYELANNIITLINKELEDDYYITVKFE